MIGLTALRPGHERSGQISAGDMGKEIMPPESGIHVQKMRHIRPDNDIHVQNAGSPGGLPNAPAQVRQEVIFDDLSRVCLASCRALQSAAVACWTRCHVIPPMLAQ